MKKFLLFSLATILCGTSKNATAQQCLTSGFCSNVPNEHKYPSATFSTTSSTWSTVSAYMNGDNYTLFNVTSGNIYEWTYCEAYGGVSTGWDAQLTLSDTAQQNFYCFSDNGCGASGNAPYISWTATFTGIVKLLTTQANCLNNTGSPYNTLVWRMANGSPSTQILGVDVYSGDGNITWSQVKTAPKVFAWAKATEGATYTDGNFTTNITNGVAAGIAMGAYHFARPENNTAATEATHFLNVAGSYIKTCELPPSLDVEDPPSGPSLQSYFTSAQLTQWVSDWCTAVKNQTGITPVIYIGGSNASYLQSSVKTYPLWMADPDNNSNTPPATLGGWSTWDFKQYSWTGTVAGIGSQCDLNVYNGNTMAAFNSFIGCVTGTAENSSSTDFIIYPNPVNDNITIENLSPNNNVGEMFSIYTVQGQLLLQQRLQQQQTEINVADYAPGIYVVKLKTENGIEIKKFVKE
ncbi:MAG: T9SS type A sorting domain-containing protein [Bacteroidetes bacterium]|nr:T9SS type A sorting domain-containing protein [Bacteroidota bacterium]